MKRLLIQEFNSSPVTISIGHSLSDMHGRAKVVVDVSAREDYIPLDLSLPEAKQLLQTLQEAIAAVEKAYPLPASLNATG